MTADGVYLNAALKLTDEEVTALSSLRLPRLGITGLGVMLSFLALPQVADPVAAVALLSVTLFFLFFGSLYWSLPAILAPKEEVGVVGGVMNFVGSSSGIAVPIITGYILQVTGTYLVALYFFAACAGLYVLGSPLIDFRQAEAR